MTWSLFAQLTEPAKGLWDYILQTGGPYGVIIILLIVALVYYVRKADKAELNYQNEKDKRLQDTREFAESSREPMEKLVEFVRTLYDLSNDRNKGK